MVARRKPIRSAVAQFAATRLGEGDLALERIASAIDTAHSHKAELVVLPECAYPAYCLPSVEAYRDSAPMANDAFLAWLADHAKRTGMHIVCGYVEDAGDCLYNAAVLLDGKGNRVGTYRKTILWGDDNDVFRPGDALPVFDTSIGVIGMAICADARAPETTACLAHAGAQIITIPTCWVNIANEDGDYYNPQADYMIRARALEIGRPILAANKYGVETDTVSYCGMSMLVGGDGEVIEQAEPDRDAVLVADIQPGSTRKLSIPDWAQDCVCSTVGWETPNIGEVGRLKVAVMPTPLAVVSEEAAQDVFHQLAADGVQVVASSIGEVEVAENMNTFARSLGMRLISYPYAERVMWDSFGSYGLLAGEDLASFAPARALALDGAAMIFAFNTPVDLATLRCRATESRVFLIEASETTARVLGPDGSVRAESDGASPAIVELDLAEAENKLCYPKTNVFEQRKPGIYTKVLGND